MLFWKRDFSRWLIIDSVFWTHFFRQSHWTILIKDKAVVVWCYYNSICFVRLTLRIQVKSKQNDLLIVQSFIKPDIFFFWLSKLPSVPSTVISFMHIQSFVTFFLFPNFFVNIIQTQTCYFRRRFESSTRYCKNFQCYCFLSFVCCCFLTAALSLKIVIEQELSCVIVKW